MTLHCPVLLAALLSFLLSSLSLCADAAPDVLRPSLGRLSANQGKHTDVVVPEARSGPVSVVCVEHVTLPPLDSTRVILSPVFFAGRKLATQPAFPQTLVYELVAEKTYNVSILVVDASAGSTDPITYTITQNPGNYVRLHARYPVNGCSTTLAFMSQFLMDGNTLKTAPTTWFVYASNQSSYVRALNVL